MDGRKGRVESGEGITEVVSDFQFRIVVRLFQSTESSIYSISDFCGSILL